MMRCFYWILFMIMAAPPTRAAEGKLTLVEQGQSQAVIVIPAREGRMVKLATILAAHLRQMSGAEIPIVTAGDLGAARVKDGRIAPDAAGKAGNGNVSYILLGESGLTRGLGLTNEGLGAGGYAIQTTGNALALYGVPEGPDYPGGDTYAVYKFLETLGCRYLWPGESGKVVPKMETIAVGPLGVRQTPPLKQRRIRFSGDEKPERNPGAGFERLGLNEAEYLKNKARAAATQAGGEWGDWQGLGGDLHYAGGHNGAGLGSAGWEKYGKEHPDWFALQADGSRDQSDAQDRWQTCISNPGLIEAVASKIIADVKRRPATTCVSLSPNDGGDISFCMCENCKELDPPEAPKIKFYVYRKGQPDSFIDYPSLTDRFVWYWNQVAARVTKVYPNLLFSIDAYSVYSTPPVREKLHPNFVVRFVPSNIDGWIGWQKAGARRIYWRPNNLENGSREGTLNHFAAHEVADKMNRLIHYNMIGTDMDSCWDHWATMGLSYYVAAKANWNPNLKYDEIVDDFCRAGFGKAAEPVKRYYQRVDAIHDPAEEGVKSSLLANYTAAVIEELRGVMGEAERAAGDDAAVKARLAFLRRGLEFTALTAEARRLVKETAAGKQLDQDAAARLLDRRWALMREIALKEPLAVNVPWAAWNESGTWKPLKWQWPGGKAKAAAGVSVSQEK